MRYLRSLSALLLSASLLSGCMSRMSYEVEDQPQARQVVQRFIEVLVKGEQGQFMQIASAPFWMGEWLDDLEEVSQEMPEDGEEGLEGIQQMEVRIYPASDLAALNPAAWDELKQAGPEQLEGLYVAAVGLYFSELSADDEEASEAEAPSPEDGLLLLRRVNGSWKLVGLIQK